MPPSARDEAGFGIFNQVEKYTMHHLTSCFGMRPLSELEPAQFFVYLDEPQFERRCSSRGDSRVKGG